MMHSLRWRFYLETGAGALTAALFLATALYPDWIEALFRVDPDYGNGSLEWVVVGALLVVTVGLFTLARREWRNSVAAA